MQLGHYTVCNYTITNHNCCIAQTGSIQNEIFNNYPKASDNYGKYERTNKFLCNFTKFFALMSTLYIFYYMILLLICKSIFTFYIVTLSRRIDKSSVNILSYSTCSNTK